VWSAAGACSYRQSRPSSGRQVEIATGTAVWYHSGLPPVPIRWLLVRDPSGELAPQAFLCTDLNAAAIDILQRFVSRWQLEVTFQESRAHLGVETQRQWSHLAIIRTTPALLGLVSLITFWANDLAAVTPFSPRRAPWYGTSRFIASPGRTGTSSKFHANSGNAPQTLSPMPRSSIKSSQVRRPESAPAARAPSPRG